MSSTLLLLLLAALETAAAARCDGPYKTLSSDCRGLSTDPNVVCVILDQHVANPASPCASHKSTVESECAARSGQPCDILTYRIDYQGAVARFRIAFPVTSSNESREARTRQLTGGHDSEEQSTVSRDLRSDAVPTTPPPVRPPQPTRVDAVPSTSVSPPPPVTTRVDARPVATVTTTPTPPQPTRVDSVPSTPASTSPQPTRVDSISSPPVTTTPTPPQPTRVDSVPKTDPPTVAPGTHVNTPASTTPTGAPATSVPEATQVDSAVTTRPPVKNDDDSTESNEFVQAIGQLRLAPSVTELRIVGGTNEFGTRGKTVQLTIDMQMLAQSPQVTSVWITNCNISSQLLSGGILSGMSSRLTGLSLTNTHMRVEPVDVSTLPNLKILQMQQNYLETLTRKMYLPLLTFLDVSENSLTSFESGFPVLESLNLNKNSFNAIPAGVFSMSKLQELQLAENPIVAIVVSVTQYEFLKKRRLKIDKPPIAPPQPVVYVAKHASTAVSIMSASDENSTTMDVTVIGLDLNSTSVDLANAVAQPVGLLVDLQGISVWKVTDAEYEVFRAQQEVIGKKDVVIGGEKVQTYLAMAASAAAAVTGAPLPSTIDPNADREKKSDAEDTSGGGKTHKTLTIVLVIVAVVVVLVAMILFVLHKRRNVSKRDGSTDTTITSPTDQRPTTTYRASKDSKDSTHNSIESFEALGATMNDAKVRDLFSSRRVRVTDIEDVRPIGAGTTGIVWLIRFRGSKFLASKRLIQSSSTSQRMAEFMNEIVIASDLDHLRIVGLVGIAWTNKSDLQALYEYMPNGDLESYLHATPTLALSWYGSKLTMAIDIVEALVCTHSFNPPLLHRDLRTRNVLLDDEMNPKLSNFGSARFASEQNTMTTDGIGSGRWLAPEILKGSTDYNTASDMYAFGVLLSELDTHATPYEDIRDAVGNAAAEAQVLALVVRGELKPSLSTSCPRQIRDIATSCLSHYPQDRPTAIHVAYQLRLLLREWS